MERESTRLFLFINYILSELLKNKLLPYMKVTIDEMLGAQKSPKRGNCISIF